MNTRIKILEEVKKILREAFPLFEQKGVVSFYIWGSLLREDFDPVISDIDLIFIFSDDVLSELQTEIKKYLANALSHLNNTVGGQGIYLSELNGDARRSFLATLHPQKIRSILSTFKSWEYVCGKKFIREDFENGDLSLEEDIASLKEQALDMTGNINDRTRNWRKDLVKNVLGIAYRRAKIQNKNLILNYNTLAHNALQEDKVLVELLAKLRKNAVYEKEVFDLYLPVIRNWVELV